MVLIQNCIFGQKMFFIGYNQLGGFEIFFFYYK